MTKRIAVIGGGYAGFEIAKGLEGHAEVTLIEPRAGFVHVPATIRALVKPELMEEIVFPYSSLLKRGRWVQARAASIAEGHVLLEDGARIEADYVVAATGSSYAAPFKPAGDDIEAFKDAHAAVAAELAEAQSVVIAGGGPVGIELAGEIAAAQPGKTVTLVSADARLMPQYPEKMSRQLEAKLTAQGVTLVLGDRAADLKAGNGPYKGCLTLASGGADRGGPDFPCGRCKGSAVAIGSPAWRDAGCRRPVCDRRLAAAFGTGACFCRGRRGSGGRQHDYCRHGAAESLADQDPEGGAEGQACGQPEALCAMENTPDPAAAWAAEGQQLAVYDPGRRGDRKDERPRSVHSEVPQGL